MVISSLALLLYPEDGGDVSPKRLAPSEVHNFSTQNSLLVSYLYTRKHISFYEVSISQISVSRLSIQCGILNILQPYRPPRPVTGIALLYGDGVCFL
jgi:hypothetical protein